MPCNFCTSYKHQISAPIFPLWIWFAKHLILMNNKYEIRRAMLLSSITSCDRMLRRICAHYYFFLICLITRKKKNKLKKYHDISMNLLHSRSYLLAFLFTFPSILDNYLNPSLFPIRSCLNLFDFIALIRACNCDFFSRKFATLCKYNLFAILTRDSLFPSSPRTGFLLPISRILKFSRSILLSRDKNVPVLCFVSG